LQCNNHPEKDNENAFSERSRQRTVATLSHMCFFGAQSHACYVRYA
jgi:hypothetical protein